MTRLVVVSGGLSSPSASRLLADRLAAAVIARMATGRPAASTTDPVTVDVVELRELAHPLADNLLTGFPTGPLAAAIDKVGDADALIVVSPVFTASYSGLFKMFFDVLEPDLLRGKPVLLAATAGTARHSLVLEHALRPLLCYLGAVTVPTAVFAATEDWGSTGAAESGLQQRIEQAAGDLAAALDSGRRPAERPTRQWGSDSGFAAPVEFPELLRRIGS